jgi:hypothetical protein
MLIVDGPYFSTKKINELESFHTNNILIKTSDNLKFKILNYIYLFLLFVF